jgi:hypothetical protein
MTTAVEIATSHGYSVETWETFIAEKNLPEGLLNRAVQTKAECEARNETVTHVLYDLNDNDEGFMILGDNPEEMCWELCDGLLEEDDRWDEVERPSRANAPG